MAEVVLRIKTNDESDVLLGFTANKMVNNVSTLLGDTTTDNDGVNGKSFAMGSLPLQDGFLGGLETKLQSEVDKYNGFMFGATDDTGGYDVTLTLQGTGLDKIMITGDKQADQFPVRAILDEGTSYEKTVFSNDASWGIAFDNEATTHTIRFIKWNRENYNACFTTIKVFLEYIELTSGRISSISANNRSSNNPDDIEYGIVYNNGSIEINGVDEEIKEYITDGIIEDKSTPVEIYVNGNKIQSAIITDSQYDDYSLQLDSQLMDDFQLIADKKYLARNLSNSMTAYALLVEIMNNLGYNNTQVDDMLSSSMVNCIDGETVKYITIKEHLQGIIILYPYLKEASNQEQINKICELAQLRCYKLPSNTFKFVSARPVALTSEIANAIKIPLYAQITEPKTTIILNNKYNAVKANYNRITYPRTEIFSATATMEFDSEGGHPYATSSNSDLTATIAVDVNYLSLSLNLKLDDINKIFHKDDKEQFTVQLTINGGKELYVTDALVKSTTTTTPFGVTKDLRYEQEFVSHYDITLVNNILSVNVVMRITKRPEVLPANTTYNGYHISEVKLTILTGCVEESPETATFSIGTGNHIYEANSNELIASTTQDIKPMITELRFKRNALTILNDYSNGVATCSLDTFCTQLDGKNWAMGEMLQPQDVVYFESDYNRSGAQRYFRVLENGYAYSGNHRNPIKLQEISKIY